MGKLQFEKEYDTKTAMRILSSLMIQCNSDGDFEFSESNISSYFGIYIDYILIEKYLSYFQSKDILEWDAFAYEEVSLDFIGKIKSGAKDFLLVNLHEDITTEINNLHERISNLEREKVEILGLDTKNISTKIKQAKNEIQNMRKKAESNDMLESLLPTLNEIYKSMERVEGINHVYDNIYLNIIKPIKVEGQNGVKATTAWAIISIVISAVISFILTNWTSIKILFTK